MPLPLAKPVAIANACETKRLSSIEITSLAPDLVLYAASMDHIPAQALTSQIVHLSLLFWSAFSVRFTVLHAFPNFIDHSVFVLIEMCQPFPVRFGGNYYLSLPRGKISVKRLFKIFYYRRLIVFSLLLNIQTL